VIGHHRLRGLPAHPALSVLFLLLVVALAAAACGSAGAGGPGVATLSSADPGASPSPSVDPQQAFVDYARCMREHGIDMPDPQVNTGDGKLQVSIGIAGNGADKKKLTDAEAACNHFISSVTLGSGKGTIDPADQDAMLAYARCMRDHGVDMPDPQFQDGGAIMKIGDSASATQIDPTSKTFKDAEEACRSKLPGGGKDGPSIQVGPGGGSGPSVQVGPDSGSGPGTQIGPIVPPAGGN
jgi:hypothetical protein